MILGPVASWESRLLALRPPGPSGNADHLARILGRRVAHAAEASAAGPCQRLEHRLDPFAKREIRSVRTLVGRLDSLTGRLSSQRAIDRTILCLDRGHLGDDFR